MAMSDDVSALHALLPDKHALLSIFGFSSPAKCNCLAL
jgi:hypothetical protein